MYVCGHVLILLIINLLNHFLVTSSRNGTRPRFRSSGGTTEDYDDLEDISTEPPRISPTEYEDREENRCQYDSCVEQQETCINLQTATGCFCPGLSSFQTPPSPPKELKLSEEDGKGVVVHWCAPDTIVTHYIIKVEGKDKVMEKNFTVDEKKRMAVLGDVAVGMHVCVEAVNFALARGNNSQSCMQFEPQTSDSGLALKLGIIGGVVGLLVVLSLALLLCRHKKLQKSTERRSNDVF
nr:LRRN4 C-terminal-like protein [Misgurnus anguillicaudatus]